jgi:hypothetical protein
MQKNPNSAQLVELLGASERFIFTVGRLCVSVL